MPKKKVYYPKLKKIGGPQFFLILDNRLFFSATLRNRDCIGDVLSRIIKKGSVLEIGSGSGEHGVFFQKRFPEIIWQTSDPELEHRKSISSWIEYEDLTKKMPQLGHFLS